MPEPLQIVTNFLSLSESLETDQAAYAQVLHPDVEQIEYPNSLNKTLQRRSFTDIIDNIRAGRELLFNAHYELQKSYTAADGTIVVEVNWQATLASDIGSLLRGELISGHFCLIFKLQDDRIIEERIYSCFDHIQ